MILCPNILVKTMIFILINGFKMDILPNLINLLIFGEALKKDIALV